MFTGISGFSSGVILLYFFAQFLNTSLFSLNIKGIFVLSLALATALFVARLKRPFALVALFLAGMLLGFGHAYFACLEMKKASLASQYDNQTLYASGYLCSLTKRSAFSHSADLCLTALQASSGDSLPAAGFKAQVRWSEDMSVPKKPLLLALRAQQARSTVNFVGFPYEAHLFYQGIVLRGTVQQVLQVNEPDSLSGAHLLNFYYHRVRSMLSSIADELLADLEHQGMLKALLLGDRSTLSPSDNKALAHTGTQHLIAISGLHVGIVMLGLAMLLPKSRLCFILVAFVGGIYVLLVGFGPSAQRAWLMCLCAMFWMAGYTRQSKRHAYLLALFLVLLIDPLAPLNPGFWFSFICVAILGVVAFVVSSAARPWRTLMLLQCLLMLGLAPVYSLLGLANGPANILANLLAVPWISLLVLPLVLLAMVVCLPAVLGFHGAFEASRLMFQVADLSLELLIAFLKSLTLFRNDWLIDSSAITSGLYLLSFLALIFLIRYRSTTMVLLSVLLLGLLSPVRINEPRNEVLIFDAGQGLAIAMTFAGQTWLFDTGPAYGRLSTVDQAILPYLRAQRLLGSTQTLMVSHGDADHAGDVSSLLKVLPTAQLFSGEPMRLQETGNFSGCHAGLQWQTDIASLQVLYPFKDPLVKADDESWGALSANNHSCVVMLSLAGKRFLLMGDLEGTSELLLVKHYREKLKADVLIAGHHGAANSSSYALLKHVQPEYVVFSAGYANSFGHPSEKVLQRINNLRDGLLPAQCKMPATLLSTAKSGALRFEVEAIPGMIRFSEARQERAAFWIKDT